MESDVAIFLILSCLSITKPTKLHLQIFIGLLSIFNTSTILAHWHVWMFILCCFEQVYILMWPREAIKFHISVTESQAWFLVYLYCCFFFVIVIKDSIKIIKSFLKSFKNHVSGIKVSIFYIKFCSLNSVFII